MKFEEEITDAETEEIEAEAKAMKVRPRPKAPGLLLTVFGSVLVVLIGGLASYYYYSFQSQGAAGEKALKTTWSEVVSDTTAVVNKLQSVDSFDQLGDTGDTALIKVVNVANQTVRDGLYDVRAQVGLSIKASTVASKLSIFLDDYSVMLAEFRRILGRVAEISEIKELDTLKSTTAKMEQSYDELLLVGGGMIQAKLPRDIFDTASDVNALLQKKIDDGGTQTEQQKAAQQAAEQAVNQFVQAWQDGDATGMSAKLTKAAKAEFSPGIVEDSVQITNFRITASVVDDGVAKVTIAGQLEKKTPDKQTLTETWEFVVLKQTDSWLIDRWQKKA
ncbi:MAG: hypothetical protein WC553_01265 [Patescibacteria group bacterium]